MSAYLIFIYLIIGFYFVVFMLGTTYDYIKQQPIIFSLICVVVIWTFWPFILYKAYIK